MSYEKNARSKTFDKFLQKKTEKWLQVTIFAFEYPGYGCSEGSPNETSINDRIRLCFQFLRDEWNIQSKHIILFGRSIGTGPCTTLASECSQKGIKIGGLILQSPYKSVKEIVKHLMGKIAGSIIVNRWNNEQEITKVTCPVLIIHGKLDNLIPYEHSKVLFELCISDRKFLELPEEADHNSFDLENEVMIPVAKFLNEECPRSMQDMILDISQRHFTIPASAKKVLPHSGSLSSPFGKIKRSLQYSSKVVKGISDGHEIPLD